MARALLRIVGRAGDTAPLSPLGRFVDELVQAFENRRPGLKDEALAPADAEAYFGASFEAERGRLREALRLADPQLGVAGRERLAGEIATFVGSTLVPAYGRLAARFTAGERNDFYVLRGPLRVLERVGFAAAGLLGGGFLVWAPFIPMWSKHWIWMFGLVGLLFPELRRYFAWKRYERELNALVARSDRELERLRESYLIGDADEPGPPASGA